MQRKTMSVRLSETEEEALKMAAADQRIPAAVLVRSIVMRWLDEKSYTTRAEPTR